MKNRITKERFPQNLFAPANTGAKKFRDDRRNLSDVRKLTVRLQMDKGVRWRFEPLARHKSPVSAKNAWSMDIEQGRTC